MPRRTDLKRILVIGSGPIVIGQACEFDYSGTQAIKALRDEGLEVVLVNSNPATIMTDPEMADRTYVEPLTVTGGAHHRRERPTPSRPRWAGRRRSTPRYGVKLIGASIAAIKVAEDCQFSTTRCFHRPRRAESACGLPSP
jgi:carbamoyl-phosphate synthase large subunit